MSGRIVSFALNSGGMGHASRLLAVHTALARHGLGSLFLVEHEQRIVSDYDSRQIVIPRHPKSLIGDDWYGSGDDFAANIAQQIIAAALTSDDVILHDVVVHRALYERSERLGCRQYLIHRPRRGRPDPCAWVAAEAPAVDTIYMLGRPDESRQAGDIRVVGISDIVREPLGDKVIWRDDETGLRIYVSAAGGGHPDAEPFLNAALEGIHEFAESTGSPISVVLTAGPYFRGTVRVPPRMAGSVRVMSYMDARHSVYRDTDVVIGYGGYNTLQELRRSGVPGVAIPGQRPLDDQNARLEQFTGDHNIVITEPTATAIAGALNRAIGRRAGADRELAQGGAFDVADDIIRTKDDR